MVEFKPKWLAQSPSAPASAIRCRTCAISLRRFILSPANHPPYRPCPLRLCDPSPDTCGEDTVSLDKVGPGAAVAIVTASADGRALMRELRDAQQRLDRRGVLGDCSDDDGEDLAKAMTLRDCTCFVYLEPSSRSVRCHLGDLDRKSGSAKAAYWRALELALVHGGFYTARHLCLAGALYPAPTCCRFADDLDRAGSGGPVGVIQVVDAAVAQGSVEESSHCFVKSEAFAELQRQLSGLTTV